MPSEHGLTAYHNILTTAGNRPAHNLLRTINASGIEKIDAQINTLAKDPFGSAFVSASAHTQAAAAPTT